MPVHSGFRSRARALLFTALLCAPALAGAAEASKAIEQALVAAQQDKRGITVYVNGQAIGGAVTKIEPGQTVELRNQQFSRITIRIDRIDGIAQP